AGWGGLWLLAGGVTAFIVAGQPRGGDTVASPLRHWLIIGLMLGCALLMTLAAKRVRMSAEAALLAVAAGLLYGLQDALTRVS
ncbi:membrane protein, partial [Streptomyces varsoviensis]